MHIITVSPPIQPLVQFRVRGLDRSCVQDDWPVETEGVRDESMSRTPGQMTWAARARAVVMIGAPPGRPWALRYLLSSEITEDLAVFHMRPMAAMIFFGRSPHETGNDIPVPNLIETEGFSGSLAIELEGRTLDSATTLLATAGGISL